MKRTALLSLVLAVCTCAQPVSLTCNEKDVGTDPPASVRFVGQNQREVPFDSWSCPGLNADNFTDPQDFPVVSIDGAVTVLFDSASATELSAVGSSPEMVDGHDFEVELLEPGRARIEVPDPTIDWLIRLRIATGRDRVAYYEMVLAPPG